MKQLFAFLALFGSFAATAQSKPVAKKPVSKPAATPAMKTRTDSISYAIGLSVATFYKHQGIEHVNSALVERAINDITNNKTPLLSSTDANDVMTRYMNEMQQKQETQAAEKAAPTIKAGEAFLAQNKTKPGVKTTTSGLQYEVITPGTGPTPTANDTVVCHYRGTLLDSTEFDNSYKRGEPLTIPVSGVIRGWTEALQLMPVGSKYKIYIPQELGYGTFDNGGPIPPGSVLVFEVELLEIKGKTSK
jgi:FKBP-type peptidyl-prolyl cis-trans isomerase